MQTNWSSVMKTILAGLEIEDGNVRRIEEAISVYTRVETEDDEEFCVGGTFSFSERDWRLKQGGVKNL